MPSSQSPINRRVNAHARRMQQPHATSISADFTVIPSPQGLPESEKLGSDIRWASLFLPRTLPKPIRYRSTRWEASHARCEVARWALSDSNQRPLGISQQRHPCDSTVDPECHYEPSARTTELRARNCAATRISCASRIVVLVLATNTTV